MSTIFLLKTELSMTSLQYQIITDSTVGKLSIFRYDRYRYGYRSTIIRLMVQISVQLPLTLLLELK